MKYSAVNLKQSGNSKIVKKAFSFKNTAQEPLFNANGKQPTSQAAEDWKRHMTTPHSIERDPNQYKEHANPETQSIKSFQNIEIQRNLSNVSNYQVTDSYQNSRGRRVALAHEDFMMPNEATITERQEPAETPSEAPLMAEPTVQEAAGLVAGTLKLVVAEPESKPRLESATKQVCFSDLKPAVPENMLTEGMPYGPTGAAMNVMPE